MVQVTDSQEETSGKRVVFFRVIPLPADNTKIGGQVKMLDSEPGHMISAHHDGATNLIADAWRLAWKIASERNAEFILIDDPKKLFPREKWPRSGDFLGNPDLLGNRDILQKTGNNVLDDPNVLSNPNILK